MKTVYKFLPYFIFYTKNLPENIGGCTNAFIIRIKPKYKNDLGIHKHEIYHVKQWYRTCGLHSFLYLFSKKYKLKSEIEAYKEQLKYYPDDRTELFAKFICENYGLNVKKEEVIFALKN